MAGESAETMTGQDLSSFRSYTRRMLRPRSVSIADHVSTRLNRLSRSVSLSSVKSNSFTFIPVIRSIVLPACRTHPRTGCLRGLLWVRMCASQIVVIQPQLRPRCNPCCRRRWSMMPGRPNRCITSNKSVKSSIRSVVMFISWVIP